MELRQRLANNIRRLRLLKGWSQEDLAAAAEIDRTYVSAIERCRYSVSLDVLERLARALEVEAHLLILQEENGSNLRC